MHAVAQANMLAFTHIHVHTYNNCQMMEIIFFFNSVKRKASILTAVVNKKKMQQKNERPQDLAKRNRAAISVCHNVRPGSERADSRKSREDMVRISAFLICCLKKQPCQLIYFSLINQF